MARFTAAQVGDRVAERVLGPLSRLDIARFSVASGDPNRVHIEEEVAAAAGLPSVIGSGGIVTALATDIIACWAGMGSIRKAVTRITSPLFPGAIVTASAVVTGRTSEADQVVFEVRAEVVDQAGTNLFEGMYTVTPVDR